MTKRLDPSREIWMHASETRAVMGALLASGGDARFVGGAVRNALLNCDVGDIDIATPLVPAEVTRRFESAGITALPTGIAHGTITAITGGKAFEVTTLRRDVSTDGRRATVEFSDDWAEDAGRRDFTINALYASPDGEVFDFAGGLADLAAGRVRFIGEATARIREDYLRILRLFRFHAWYGKGGIDEEGLRAAAAERSGLQKLSGERVQKELLRLLEAENPLPSLHAMAATGILAEIIPNGARLDRLERLTAVDAANFFKADAVLRLAALLPHDLALVKALAERLRLSNENRERTEDLAGARKKLVPYLSVREVHRLLYRLGARRFRDRVFLRWSEDGKESNAIAWRALLALADTWTPPRFPLTGRDVMVAGVPEGPHVGRVLAEVEEWWIDSGFTEDRLSLAERLKAIVQSSTY